MLETPATPATLPNLFAEDATPPLNFTETTTPTDNALRGIASAARQLAAADARLKRAEALCELIRARKHRLATKVLPELFDQAMTDHAGLPELNCDVVVENYYHAAIKADWPDEQRQAAFAHLEQQGGGDLIAAELRVVFSKEDYDLAQKLQSAVAAWLAKAKLDTTPALSMAVNWRTLTSWFRDRVETPLDPHSPPVNTPPLDPALIGATAGRVCRIVPRKVAKPTRVLRKK